jgi:hypothetical protein
MALDAAIVSVLVNGAQIALQSYFSYMRLAGKTDEEIKLQFEYQKARFDANNPDQLVDV